MLESYTTALISDDWLQGRTLLSDDMETEGGWRSIRASAESVLDGYYSQAMTVWNSAGKPVLVGRQNIAIFA